MPYRIFVDGEEIKPPEDFTKVLDAEKDEKEKFITGQIKSTVNSTKEEKEKYYAHMLNGNLNAIKTLKGEKWNF